MAFRVWSTLIVTCLFVFGSLAAAGAEPVKLLWATCCAQTDRHEMFQRWAERFEARNPDIDIEWTYPTGNFTERITTMMAAGTEPDVIWAGVAFWSWYDNALSMEELMRDPNMADIYPAARQWYTWRGELRGIPYGANSTVIYYNKRHLAEFGLVEPTADWTWDDMIDYARRLTVTSGDGFVQRYGVHLHNGGIHQAILTYGSPFFSEDGKRTLIDNPGTRAAVAKLAEIMSPSLGVYAGTDKTWLEHFVDGTASLVAAGVWAIPSYRAEMQDEWDVVPYPYVEAEGGRYRSAFASGEGWMIPKTTKHPQEAMRFVQFLMEPEQMLEFASLGGIIPTQASVAQSSFLTNPPPPQNLMAFTETVQFSNPMHFYHPKATPVWNTIAGILNDALAGNIPAEQAVSQMADLSDAVLAEE